MIHSVVKVPDNDRRTAPDRNEKPKKHFKLIESTYDQNTASDYTEKIEELDRNFDYRLNCESYWSQPEQSLLYGTPFYNACSESQKLALNHLHWFANYNYVADTETETVTFNQVTASVFSAVGGYEKLAEMLTLETEQEHYHIHAFRKIGLATANALMGKQALKALLKWHTYKLTLGRDRVATSLYQASRCLSKVMLSGQKRYYSQYLKDLEQQNKYISETPTSGILGRKVAPPLQRFLGFNWGGGSPFLACQFYVLRMMGNMTLKNMEYPIVKYFRKLEKQGAAIPDPTRVSNYHFLDESFHTTTSLLIARDMYKDFPAPTAYEKFIANLSIYLVQNGTLGGLSGVFTHRFFSDDLSLMELVYRLLRAPLFSLSAADALHWMEQCFCREHQGFHTAVMNHQRLLTDHHRFFDSLDYLWPVNREMRLMAAGSSIDKALASNTKTFQVFSNLIAA